MPNVLSENGKFIHSKRSLDMALFDKAMCRVADRSFLEYSAKSSRTETGCLIFSLDATFHQDLFKLTVVKVNCQMKFINDPRCLVSEIK